MTGRTGRRRLGAWPAGLKLAALAAAGAGLFFVADPRLLAAAGAVPLLLAVFARVPMRVVLNPLRAALPVLALVLVAQGLGGDWRAGAVAALRLATLMMLGALVSATTGAAALTEAFARGLRPLRWVGLDPETLALGLSLALRFLPVIAAEAALVRDTQRARGLERHPLALLVPLAIRVIGTAEAVGEAIEARGGGDAADQPRDSRG